MKPEATFQWLLVSILIAAAALRFAALGRQSLWDDEGYTLQDVHIIPGQDSYEVQPPLYFVLLRGWTRLAGTSVPAVRAFSAFCGLAGVALLGLAARRMISPAAGLFAAAVLCLHPFHLAYSQEARCYALAFGLALTTVWAAWERKRWIYVVLSTALFWTHPWGIFVWLITVAQLRSWVVAVPVVSGFPALWHATQSPIRNLWAHSPDWRSMLLTIDSLSGGSFYVGGWRFSIGWPEGVLISCFALLWILGACPRIRRSREACEPSTRHEEGGDVRRPDLTLLWSAAALFVLPLASGFVIPEISAHSRYFLMTLPFTMLLAGRGWISLPKAARIVTALVILGVFSWSISFYFTRWQKGNMKQVAEDVKALARTDAAVIVPDYMRSLWDYYDRSHLPVLDEGSIDIEDRAIQQHPVLIFVTLDVPNELRDALNSRYRVLEFHRYPADFDLGVTMTCYRVRPDR